MRIIVFRPYVCGKPVWDHGFYFLFAAKLLRHLVVPALIVDHIQRLLQFGHFLFNGFALRFKQVQPLAIGGFSFLAPCEKLADGLDIQAAFFQALNDLQCFQLSRAGLANSGNPLQIGKEANLVIIAKRGNRKPGHF